MAVHSLHHSFLGEAYRLAGRMGEADRAAQHALELARARKEPRNEIRALWLLGTPRSRGNALERERAEAFYRQAVGIAERLDLRPWAADCRLDLGFLYWRRDAVGEARQEIGTPLALYREMGSYEGFSITARADLRGPSDEERRHNGDHCTPGGDGDGRDRQPSPARPSDRWLPG